MERQFTATVYIIDKDKVLLIYHEKLCKWLPAGGHIEADETPPEAARREAMEETGYEIEFIKDEHIWIDRWNAKSMERPFLCLLEEIPAHKDKPAHQHMDMIFVARPTKHLATNESNQRRWFTLEEVMAMQSDVEIFAETKDVITLLMNKFSKIGAPHA